MSFLSDFLQREGTIGAAYLINKAINPQTKWVDFRDAIEQDAANTLVQKVAGHVGIDTSAVETQSNPSVKIQK